MRLSSSDQADSALLRSLEEIAWQVNSKFDPAVLLQQIASTVATHSPWSLCWIGLADRASDRFIVQADSGLGYDTFDWPFTGSPSAVAIDTGAPLAIEDIRDDQRFPRIRQDAEQRGYRAILVVPLQLGDDSGAMWFCSTTPCTFRSTDVAYATVIAAHAAIALRNAKALARERELRERESLQRAELERLQATTEQQRAELEFLDRVRNQMLSTLLEGGGVSSLIRYLAERFGNPVVILNQFGARIAGHPVEKAEVTDSATEISEHILAAATTHPVMVTGGSKRWIVVRLHAELSPIGYMCVGESNRAFERIDLSVAGQAAPIVALALLNERIRIESEARLESEFVDAIASVSPGEAGALVHRASVIGLDLKHPLMVCVAARDAPSVGSRDDITWVIKDRLRHALPSSVLISHGEAELVIILPVRSASATTLPPALQTALVSALYGSGSAKPRSLSFAVGIGSAGIGIEDLRVSYREAVCAVRILQALGRKREMLAYAEAGTYSLLANDEGRPGQLRFARRLLDPLREYERRYSTPLIETIEQYILANGKVHRAAEAMNIHSTTVRYRLGRVEKILGKSLADPELVLGLHLALKIAELSGMRTERQRHAIQQAQAKT